MTHTHTRTVKEKRNREMRYYTYNDVYVKNNVLKTTKNIL